jgi:hypothetical protein
MIWYFDDNNCLRFNKELMEDKLVIVVRATGQSRQYHDGGRPGKAAPQKRPGVVRAARLRIPRIFQGK